MGSESAQIANAGASWRTTRRGFASASGAGVISVLMQGCSNKRTSGVEFPLTIPLSLGSIGSFAFPCSAGEAKWFRAQMVPRAENLNQGQCLHMLYLHGSDAEFEDCRFSSSAELLRVFLDTDVSEKLFGQPCFVKSRFGVRVPGDAKSSAADEAHRDQTLAVLGHLGVSSGTKITLANSEKATVRDAIDDSIATFDLGTAELEWIAWAYAMYLPPNRRWTNRFGDCFTFDMLVGALRSKSLPSASCGGAHVLFSLTMILRADGHSAILTDASRRSLEEFLVFARDEAIGNQHDDGSWSLSWHRKLVPKTVESMVYDSSSGRLIATGHIAEWLLYLPEELQPPEEVYRKAALWLASELRRVELKQSELFCPFTHALFVVNRGSESALRQGP